MTTTISPCNRLSDTIQIFQPTNKKEWAALGLSCATLLISSGAAVAAGVGYLGYKMGYSRKTSRSEYSPNDLHPSSSQ